MRIRAVALILYAAAIFNAAAFDVKDTSVHLYLAGLKKAAAPVVVGSYLIFSAAGPYRFVGLAFSHEAWKDIHAFEKNEYGIFVFALQLPRKSAQTIRYRLVVDGVWTSDPNNSEYERDPVTGAALSLAVLPKRSDRALGAWEPAQEGCATFYFEGQPGLRVTVAGSFNGWDPFIHELIELAPGKYELSLDLHPGVYYYCFIYKGAFIADPLNKHLFYTKEGRSVSALTIADF